MIFSFLKNFLRTMKHLIVVSAEFEQVLILQEIIVTVLLQITMKVIWLSSAFTVLCSTLLLRVITSI